MTEPGYARDQQGKTKVVEQSFNLSQLHNRAKHLTLTLLFQASLEASWSGLVEKLGGDGERAKAGKLQPALFNLYRQARQAERLKKKHSLSKNPCLLSLFSSVPSQCSVMGVQLLRMWFSSTRMVCLWKLRLVQSVY